MQAKKYMYFAEWLNVFMILMLIFSGAEWIYCALNIGVNNREVFPAIVFLVLFSYFVRVYTENIILFILLHLAEAAIMFIVPLELPYKVLGFIILVTFTVCDFIFWAGEGVRSYIMVNPAGVGVILLIFAYASYHDKPANILQVFF